MKNGHKQRERLLHAVFGSLKRAAIHNIVHSVDTDLFVTDLFDVKNSVRVADRILYIHVKMILLSHRFI